MPTAPKLDTILSTNVATGLTVVRRSGPYDNKFKPGEKQWLYIFSQKGNEYSQYVNEREQKTLELFKYGQEVICTRKETAGNDGKRFYFREWTAPGDISVTAAPQLQSNTNVTRTQPKQQDEYQNAQEKREMRISLAGLMQAHIARGESNKEALELAIEAKRLLDAHVERSFGNPDVFPEGMTFNDYLNSK